MGHYKHSTSVDAKIMISKLRVAQSVIVDTEYDLLKTTLILALSAYNSKSSSVAPIFVYYRIKMHVFAPFKN